MTKKKSASRHQSFRLSPHGHNNQRVMLYIVVAFVVGFGVGLMYGNQALASMGIVSY